MKKTNKNLNIRSCGGLFQKNTQQQWSQLG